MKSGTNKALRKRKQVSWSPETPQDYEDVKPIANITQPDLLDTKLQLGLDTLIQASAIWLGLMFLADFNSRGLGTSNGRFISFCDSLDTCVSFRNRLPPAPSRGTQVACQPLPAKSLDKPNHSNESNITAENNVGSKNGTQDSHVNSNTNDVQASPLMPDPKVDVNPKTKSNKPDTLNHDESLARYKRLAWTKRQGSVFALRSNKNSSWWICYVAVANFLLKFLGGTIISYVVHRTPVLFQGVRHYTTFFVAVVLVQLSPNDIVYRILSKSTLHRIVMGLGMTLYKYRKVTFAVETTIDNGCTVAEIVLVGALVIELNSLIRNGERYLTHWTFADCIRAAPMGVLRSLFTTKTGFSVASTIGIYLSMCCTAAGGESNASSYHYFLQGFVTSLSFLCMAIRYNFTYTQYVMHHLAGVSRAHCDWGNLKLEARIRGVPRAIIYSAASLYESMVNAPKAFALWRIANEDTFRDKSTHDEGYVGAAVAMYQSLSNQHMSQWGFRLSWIIVTLVCGEIEYQDGVFTTKTVPNLLVALYPVASEFFIQKLEMEHKYVIWQSYAQLVLGMFVVEYSFMSDQLLLSPIYQLCRTLFCMWCGDPMSIGIVELNTFFKSTAVEPNDHTLITCKTKNE